MLPPGNNSSPSKDDTESVFRLGQFRYKRVPMGHAASTAEHAEELDRKQAEFESLTRIEKLFHAW